MLCKIMPLLLITMFVVKRLTNHEQWKRSVFLDVVCIFWIDNCFFFFTCRHLVFQGLFVCLFEAFHMSLVFDKHISILTIRDRCVSKNCCCPSCWPNENRHIGKIPHRQGIKFRRWDHFISSDKYMHLFDKEGSLTI